jgi:chromosome segregation ATPase
MGAITKTLGVIALAGGTFIAGAWLGTDDLNHTKEVINEMVTIVTDLDEDNGLLEQDKQSLENRIKVLNVQIEELTKKDTENNGVKAQLEAKIRELAEAKGELTEVNQQLKQAKSENTTIKAELEKANDELIKANREAKELREYADLKLQEVQDIVNE